VNGDKGNLGVFESAQGDNRVVVYHNLVATENTSHSESLSILLFIAFSNQGCLTTLRMNDTQVPGQICRTCFKRSHQYGETQRLSRLLSPLHGSPSRTDSEYISDCLELHGPDVPNMESVAIARAHFQNLETEGEWRVGLWTSIGQRLAVPLQKFQDIRRA
jgi:hypothetical protein